MSRMEAVAEHWRARALKAEKAAKVTPDMVDRALAAWWKYVQPRNSKDDCWQRGAVRAALRAAMSEPTARNSVNLEGK